nr:hypothetical protein [uncultured Psychroserpens sp.]
MKCTMILFLMFTAFSYAQRDRVPIDSIHNKRLCTVYPGMTKFQTIQESFDESKLVFTGKVIEVIRTETVESSDFGFDENGKEIALHIEPIYNYWYIFEVKRWFKGDAKTKRVKIYSRIYSNVSPLLLLNKNYLIFAVEGELQESPYIYCNGNSTILEYASQYIKELELIHK